MESTAFNPKTRKWERQFPGSLAQHDVVYGSPPEDALQGIPLGNGDMGLLLWTEGSKLMAALNKGDLFDDYPEPGGATNHIEYDHEPTLKHGARLVIDFQMPVFDVLFLQEFKARLSLADATAKIESKTPFLNVKLNAFTSHPDRIIAVDCEVDCDEEISATAVMERFGSRPYPYWYSAINRDATIGLDGTQTEIVDDTVLIRQDLRTLHFVAGARITGMKKSTERLNRHSGRFTTAKANKLKFTLLLTILTSENSPDPKADVLKILDKAAGKSMQALYKAHAKDWKNFWNASFISIPNNYLENIWYLNLYHANSSCRAEYPPRFNNGIWSWNRDVSNWVFYFHWNMQNFIWPLHAANHAELTEPYYKFRFRSLPNALVYAKNNQGHEGAFYADVVDRLGNNKGSRWHNETPGSQIALLFWKHYKFTRDKHFLEEKAWPVIKEVARYYASLVEKGKDGVYRSPCSQAYEGSPLFEEVVTDTAMIQSLMAAGVECAELMGYQAGELGLWQEIGDNMNGFHIQALDDDEIEITADGRSILKHGLGKGCEVMSGSAFTVGKYLMVEGEDRKDFKWENLPDFISKPLEGIKKGDRIRCRHGNPDRPAYYGIPDPEFAPVFPAELIGLKDRESGLFKTSVDQVRLHPLTKPPEITGAGSMAGTGSAMCMGWCPYPIVLARLGLAVEAAEAAENSIMAWQFYCQGFGHYGPYEVFTKDKDSRWHTNTVTDVKTKEKLLSPAWPFRHFTFEAVPIVCTALNEMLLQSHEGFIRLFPALPRDWEGSFMLAAEGGFIVNTQYSRGSAGWVGVESRLGGECRMVNPWHEEKIFVTVLDEKGNETVSFSLTEEALGLDSILKFETQAGSLYMLSPAENILLSWKAQPVAFEQNEKMKTMGTAQLGLPRMY